MFGYLCTRRTYRFPIILAATFGMMEKGRGRIRSWVNCSDAMDGTGRTLPYRSRPLFFSGVPSVLVRATAKRSPRSGASCWPVGPNSALLGRPCESLQAWK